MEASHMAASLDIDIVHTTAGEMHPSGWLVRVDGDASVVAPIEDAVDVALRIARDVTRRSGCCVWIRVIDEDGSVELARYGEVATPCRAASPDAATT
jgi:hypothetical protein